MIVGGPTAAVARFHRGCTRRGICRKGQGGGEVGVLVTDPLVTGRVGLGQGLIGPWRVPGSVGEPREMRDLGAPDRVSFPSTVGGTEEVEAGV